MTRFVKNQVTNQLKTTKIDDDVCAYLRSGSWSGLHFTMPLMSPKSYRKVKKVMETLGGKWNRSALAIVFEDEDAKDSLMEAAQTGEYVDLKRAYQQFYTPDALVERMVAAAGLQDGKRVLEPSAGTGQLLNAIAKFADNEGIEVSVTAVELAIGHIPALLAHSIVSEVCNRDFLDVDPDIFKNRIDVVIMNPPFTRGQDIDHVMHAWKFLKPGGRLVALTAPGWTFHKTKKAQDFRDFVTEYGEYKEVPAGTFKESGTMVRTILIVLYKPKE